MACETPHVVFLTETNNKNFVARVIRRLNFLNSMPLQLEGISGVLANMSDEEVSLEVVSSSKEYIPSQQRPG